MPAERADFFHIVKKHWETREKKENDDHITPMWVLAAIFKLTGLLERVASLDLTGIEDYLSLRDALPCQHEGGACNLLFRFEHPLTTIEGEEDKPLKEKDSKEEQLWEQRRNPSSIPLHKWHGCINLDRLDTVDLGLLLVCFQIPMTLSTLGSDHYMNIISRDFRMLAQKFLLANGAIKHK